MPIVKPKSNSMEKIKIAINSEVLKEIKKYCEWSKIDLNSFFEQAAQFIFQKDADWKQQKKKPKAQ